MALWQCGETIPDIYYSYSRWTQRERSVDSAREIGGEDREEDEVTSYTMMGKTYDP